MGKGNIAIAIAALALLSAPEFSRAGAANATLSCSGANKASAVSLAGSIPGDTAEFDLTLSHGGERLAMQSEQDRINAVTAFSKGVFVVTVALQDNSNLQLYALPKSISYRGSHNAGELHASFKAVLAEAPGQFRQPLQGQVLSCSYAYTL